MTKCLRVRRPLAEIGGIAEKPTLEEWRERLVRRARVRLGEFAADAVRAERDER